ncbi:hypothetical protein SLA2020_432090 [Shorea laevis]
MKLGKGSRGGGDGRYGTDAARDHGEENALAKRDGESKGARSDFRRRRESGDRTTDIQRRVGDLSINSGMERVKVSARRKETE